MDIASLPTAKQHDQLRSGQPPERPLHSKCNVREVDGTLACAMAEEEVTASTARLIAALNAKASAYAEDLNRVVGQLMLESHACTAQHIRSVKDALQEFEESMMCGIARILDDAFENLNRGLAEARGQAIPEHQVCARNMGQCNSAQQAQHAHASLHPTPHHAQQLPHEQLKHHCDPPAVHENASAARAPHQRLQLHSGRDPDGIRMHGLHDCMASADLVTDHTVCQVLVLPPSHTTTASGYASMPHGMSAAPLSQFVPSALFAGTAAAAVLDVHAHTEEESRAVQAAVYENTPSAMERALDEWFIMEISSDDDEWDSNSDAAWLETKPLLDLQLTSAGFEDWWGDVLLGVPMHMRMKACSTAAISTTCLDGMLVRKPTHIVGLAAQSYVFDNG